jgi:ferric-dicitrate binding protein FerR (iron transport regulator)
LTGIPVADITVPMVLDILPEADGVAAGSDDALSVRQPRRRRRVFTLLALVALAAALIVVGVLVDPSAGAAGGCGGG